jgi:hypothetical protein
VKKPCTNGALKLGQIWRKRIDKKLEEMVAGGKDRINRLELMQKLEYQKLLTKEKLRQEQEATERLHTETLAY